MFGKKKFKVTSSKVDPAGKKTTITISTDDESIVRKLLDSKKDAMDAEFKETKKDFGTNKKNPKPTSKSTKKTSLKVLPKPVEKSKPKLSRKSIVGKAEIKHNTRNLNDSQVSWSNHHSFNGTRGTNMKKSYENYRHKIEFSGLSNIQKSKLLDKLYKLYAPILKYDSQWYSPMVSGPARYPQAKMDKIYERMMEANSVFVDWWKSIEPQLEASTKSKKQVEQLTLQEMKEKIKKIKEGFNLWYNRLLAEIPALKEKGYSLKHSSNAAMAQSYVSEALKVDTALYKELFEKLDKICNFSKNSNFYKSYKFVQEGKLSSDSIQKQNAEDNKVIFTCSDYTIRNLKIDAGKRIAIKFTFYPKPQLVYALKKRGFIWYYFEKCFICKPERFDLEWAKNIKNQYEKYL
ncbi:MAG: hypothetical protein HFG91_07690 [Acholeplasmatales bacterium]|nr:hypothetical protein [Acholeplasmatales bacterium]